jgi:hypothetical protein
MGLLKLRNQSPLWARKAVSKVVKHHDAHDRIGEHSMASNKQLGGNFDAPKTFRGFVFPPRRIYVL